MVLSSATAAKLRQLIADSHNEELQKGQTWYLMDPRWMKQLRKYLGLDPDVAVYTDVQLDSTWEDNPSENPGPIDNSPLFAKKDGEGSPTAETASESDDEADIREQLIVDLDYMLISQELWDALLAHFGITTGQKPIKRKVIESGMFIKHCKVEVYLLEFQLAENSNLDVVKRGRFSKTDTFETIEKEMRRMFSIPPDARVRLWNKYDKDTLEQMTDMTATVQQAGLFSGQLIIIEQKRPDGNWARQVQSAGAALTGMAATNKSEGTSSLTNGALPSASACSTGAIEKAGSVGRESAAASGTTTPAPSTSTSASTAIATLAPMSTRNNYSSSYNNDGGVGDKAQPGLCGLSNLGNTCFMNSIIQGLSNCPPITEYFANDNYTEDINVENPLGMRGEIARSFGELIKGMWSGRYTHVMPRNFKMAVGRFAPQFSGYQQQDSQELLTFLLDGLHEDLNRIKKKPYIEMTDSDDRPDEEVAAEAWENYKKRNDSVILDLFHGLLKSTVVCPECPKVSVTFDPFCILSLPLPVKKERKIEVFLVYLDPKKCVKQFKVTVPKHGVMADLCASLSKLSDIAESNMVVTDVYNHRFHKIYNRDDPLSNILDRDDIFVYETPDDPSSMPSQMSQHVLMPVYLRSKKTEMAYSPSNLFGQPIIIPVPKEGTTYSRLYSLVLNRLGRFVTQPVEGQEWWRPPAPQATSTSTDTPDGNAESTAWKNATSTAEEQEEGSSMSVESNLQVDDAMDEEEEEDDCKGPPRLFVMRFVNSYGNSVTDELRNDDQPIKFGAIGKQYLALDWHSKAKELFYDEKEAEAIAQHTSLDAKSPPRKQVHLDECLELYTSREKLGENDAWYCPSCKKHQQATKKFDLWSLPSLLVISLKRFSYDRYWRNKLDTHVEFPTRELDMGPYVINPNHGEAIYDLVAVSNHYGGMGGGHYTAYAKNKDDEHWYYFDDASVSSASEDVVVSKAAYVLFYQRRDLGRTQRQPGPSALPMSTLSTGVNGRIVENGDLDAASEEDMEVN